MSVKDLLQPIVITYNRKNSLKITLSQLVAENSPIKDCDFTILDNCSTDGTKEFCEEFCKTHLNFNYIRNSKNIGISGNIIEAMKLASKKWLWILCDDDDFHWTGWEEIENALFQDYDAVHVRQNIVGKNDYAHLINDEAFLPNVIYNTKHITDVTLQNAYGIAHTLCPHHAIGCKIINENGKIFVPTKTKDIMNAGLNDISKKDWFRIPKSELYNKFAYYDILIGYINSYQLINDMEVRRECANVLCQGFTFEQSMQPLLGFCHDNVNHFLFELYGNLCNEQREKLIIAIMADNSSKKDMYINTMNENLKFLLPYFSKKYQNIMNVNINDILAENQPVSYFEYQRVRFLSKITFGKTKQHYIEKKNNLKKKLLQNK